jgi:FHA domain
METPHIRIESTGAIIRLRQDVTTIGRGKSVDVHLDHPSVSKLHAEIVRRGPYAYVSDLGLSRHGTRVNGKVVAQRLLENGDVVSFGSQRCRIGGLQSEGALPETEPRRSATPELTRREVDVVAALCKPALYDDAFVAPATARDIAADLVVTEAAVKQHLLRLYQKLKIAEGPNRRVRLANEVVARGLVRPLPIAAGPDGRAQADGPSLPAVPTDAAQLPPPQAAAPQPTASHSQPGPRIPAQIAS